ncbi:unnamed protein product [Durusdinium trenchii]|uniref:Uncharacterized protein n=1 Tax=Durusdinium trenchii TaxID=1381693 RepID=A0ABP0PS74_9DINO
MSGECVTNPGLEGPGMTCFHREFGRDAKDTGRMRQPEFCSWAFGLPRGEPLAQVWEKMPDRVDVLMTHGPAHCAQTKTETETRAAEIARGFSD